MREWYFQAMGQELGPFSVAELKAKVEGGQIQPDTMVRRGADGKWLFAERVKGLLPASVLSPEPAAAPKSSATIPVLSGSEIQSRSASRDATRPTQAHTIALAGDDESDDSAKAPSSEFYDFVGFREAISPVLHRAVSKYLIDHRLTMTQLNRRALASFIARPELASDLMISQMAVIPQKVNEKSNADGSRPLSDREKSELATFRLTLFNCSNIPLDVNQGEFLVESIDSRTYDRIGSDRLPPIDHAGHLPVNLEDIKSGSILPMTMQRTIAPLAAENVTIWFRSKKKPSLMSIRGQLKFGEGEHMALSESFTIIIHGDSP